MYFCNQKWIILIENSFVSFNQTSCIAVEDIIDKSLVTNASLYNGQPLDTGLMCHGTELAFCTPPTLNVQNGVSVENVHTQTLQWFVLRVSYGRVLKAKDILEARNMECYVPMRYKQVKKHRKIRVITEPLLPSFIFAHSSPDEVDAMLHDEKVNSIESRLLLSYYYDHTNYREDAPDCNPPLIISDVAMNNFIRLTSIKNPHIIPVTSENIQYKQGDSVVITEGDFKGIQGRVARIAGQQRVIIELFSGCLVATAYIPKEAMEKIDKERD